MKNDVTDESLCGIALKCYSKNVAAYIYKNIQCNGPLYNANVLLNIEEVVFLGCDQELIYSFPMQADKYCQKLPHFFRVLLSTFQL